ncbi:MAG: hypothetical protein IIZ13_04870 [Renibacterium sp.]|nr:hypothetical protein [Renibacterium sp.]
MEAATPNATPENSSRLEAAKRHRKQGLKWLVTGVLFFAAAVVYYFLVAETNRANAIVLLAAYAIVYVAPVVAGIGLIRMVFGMVRIAKLKPQPVR